MKVLVVSSGSKTEVELCSCLKQHSYDVHRTDFENSLASAARLLPEFVIMSLNNAEVEKKEFYAQLNRWEVAPLIVVLNSKISADLKIKILDAGATDLLSHPFGTGELMARMRAILRRGKDDKRHMPSFTSDQLHIEFSTSEVYVRGKKLLLTPTEYKLLRHLVLSRNRLITRDELLWEVLGQDNPKDGLELKSEKRNAHLLRVHINNLRNKIEEDPKNPLLIQTETRLGYRFRSP